MDQIAMRGRARVPAINCKSSASSARLDRHLAVLGGPAVPQREVEGATLLMRELTSRDQTRAKQGRTAKVSLLAPLKRLRRSLFGNHG
ncbi:hypothetical protein [Streptomyces albireticuli]|uniref:Uncharacterized protein n=1 Tax=Streptomyces albireticuli TaxID=1940 RepID=A0A2A2D6I7_9ACTN|nr:hypothetical protein [Streptomyces albireticuli]MCD9143490.1 hypothetical protein [Streptomyces albireticuli]MCD9164849.1 hypothetical protein [Streptomyces albireticuli]MCD9191607.1 hypothetical protein [Streptomyces albireticuli]PAU47121.1 hypothetical protein CK936_20415 [Streptomyces albireticuli]